MKKNIIFLLLIFAVRAASAQSDKAVYYLKNSGEQVTTKDSADIILKVSPADANRQLFEVKGYYPNGKIRLSETSQTQTLPLKLHGDYVDYFPNGNKMKVRRFTDGRQTGSIIEYYPNGNFYSKKRIKELADHNTAVLYEECSDSTGKALTKKGNGYWITYNRDFTKVTEQGKAVDGFRDSTWTIMGSNNEQYTQQYQQGDLITHYKAAYAASVSDEFVDTRPPGSPDTIPPVKIFTSVEQMPEFPGGLDALANFLRTNLQYPKEAQRNGIYGRVVVSFVVEKDGTLTNVKIARGIGGGCDEEAVRVVSISPKWKPGIQNNRPVRVAYSVPIKFTL
jgi:TonB family protein